MDMKSLKRHVTSKGIFMIMLVT
ncbi:BnaA08g04790D [Brassica napus]|uniref:BnaA08g04790D protein n=1 Tax=Brassica napus TaxID=3708 RepID=A0A078HAQ9_BRANA|nr:BnaA08g04790D [Brassica napus]